MGCRYYSRVNGSESKLKIPPTVEYASGKKGKLDEAYNSAFGFGFIYGAGATAILAILLVGAFY